MTLEDLMNEWEKDTSSVSDLGMVAMDTAKLHAKYLRILSKNRLKSKTVWNDFKELRELKRRYYRGELNNTKDLAEHGLEPYRGPSSKIDVDALIESDKELNEILLKKAYYDEIVEFCTAVIKELGNRTYAVGSAIKWEMYKGGA